MDNKNIARLYFSNKQARDNLFINAIRSLTWRVTIAKTLNACGVEYGTITAGQGLYKGGNEPSIQIFILGIKKQTAIKLSQAIRKAFNQDSVMLEYNGNFSFIG